MATLFPKQPVSRLFTNLIFECVYPEQVINRGILFQISVTAFVLCKLSLFSLIVM